MPANSPLLNLPSLPLFNLNVQVLINASWTDGGNPPSEFPSCNILLAGFHLFQLSLEVWNGDLKDERVRDKMSNDELLWTSSVSFPGKVWEVNCSTHSSSALEVVACQRYKQLNWMERLEI